MLQAILSNHKKIDTVSEPWILLPLLSVFKPSLISAFYNFDLATDALNDFLKKTNQEEDFKNDIKEFILNRYAPVKSDDGGYVLDKTPRYYEIFEVIYDLFPKAKFIILKRHPVAVLSSIIKTWDRFTFKELEHHHNRDIFKAPYLLSKWEEEYGERSNVSILKYEDLVEEPNSKIEEICAWLGLDYQPSILNFSENNSFQGKYGDPKGVYLTKAPSGKYAVNWKKGLSDKRIKDYLNGYGAFLGDVFLSEYGYENDIKYRNTVKFKLFRYYCHRKKLVEKHSIKDSIVSILIRRYLQENIG